MHPPEHSRRVEYPDFWPYEAYSPPVEAVHEAYMGGELSEMRLEEDLEHALEHPEPPTRYVCFGPESAVLLFHGDFPLTVAELDGVDVEIDREQMEFASHRAKREATTSIEVVCPRDTVEDVFTAVKDGLRDGEEIRPDDEQVRAYTESVAEL